MKMDVMIAGSIELGSSAYLVFTSGFPYGWDLPQGWEEARISSDLESQGVSKERNKLMFSGQTAVAVVTRLQEFGVVLVQPMTSVSLVLLAEQLSKELNKEELATQVEGELAKFEAMLGEVAKSNGDLARLLDYLELALTFVLTPSMRAKLAKIDGQKALEEASKLVKKYYGPDASDFIGDLESVDDEITDADLGVLGLL